MQPVTDRSPAAWIEDRLTTFAQDVSSLVPDGFDAYARIVHPAYLGRDEEGIAVRWHDIAVANGFQPHAEMRFDGITPPGSFDGAGNQRKSQAGLWDFAPQEGAIPEPIAIRLLECIAPFTSSDERWYFAYWEGWGDPVTLSSGNVHRRWLWRRERAKNYERPSEDFAGSPRADRDTAIRMIIPARAYYLFEGSLTDALTGWTGPGSHTPTMWWPAERAWFVHTEIDLNSTYLGGSRGCIDRLLDDPELETYEVRPTSRIN